MAVPDLRQWLQDVEALGELKLVEGADWDLEIGGISEANYMRRGPALLFDRIKDYPAGYRVLTTATGSPRRLGVTLGMGSDYTGGSLIRALEGKPLQWETEAGRMDPKVVTTGPVLEVVEQGKEIDLGRFPAPKWHELDGGRYLGTGTGVITRDPETGWVNIGAYRCMVVDRNKLTIHIIPGKHGRIQIEKGFAKEGRAPVAVSVGHHPLLMMLSGLEVPTGISEYNYAGAILGRPVEVIKGPITGLPIPSAAELVLEGYLYPDKVASEGPFGEWTGYYSHSSAPVPYLAVEAVYRRRDPIILGTPPGLPPHDYSYFRTVLKSAMIRDALVKAGVSDIRGVWAHESGGGRQFVVVSISTRFCGHSRQAGFLASQLQAACYMGKYVIVVDDDIDPANLEQVVWAMCTRSEPQEDIEIIRKAWGSKADPMLVDQRVPYNSRAVIDATIPFERKGDFPVVARSSAEYLDRIRAKWGSLLWD